MISFKSDLKENIQMFFYLSFFLSLIGSILYFFLNIHNITALVFSSSALFTLYIYFKTHIYSVLIVGFLLTFVLSAVTFLVSLFL